MGCTRIAGSDYPMDTKFMTVSMLSVRTIQGHRNNLYHKLKGHNLAELNECLSQIDLS